MHKGMWPCTRWRRRLDRPAVGPWSYWEVTPNGPSIRPLYLHSHAIFLPMFFSLAFNLSCLSSSIFSNASMSTHRATSRGLFFPAPTVHGEPSDYNPRALALYLHIS